MITKSNIAAYINFLHLKKYSYPAADELKNKWMSVPESELSTQLQNLYHHWSITNTQGLQYEQEFLNNNQSYQAPPAYNPVDRAQSTPPNQSYQPNMNEKGKKSSNNFLTILLVLCALILGAIAFYYFSQNGNNSDSDNDGSVLKNSTVVDNGTTDLPDNQLSSTNDTIDNVAATPVDDNTTTSTMSDNSSAEIAAEERARSSEIRSLLNDEVQRNMGGILNHFSPNIKRYWDLKNPTTDQIKNRYYHTWGITEDINYKNVQVKRIDKNIYNLYSEYSYYSIKDKTDKVFETKTRFEFDDNGKIISTYGL